jgi:hypothetical protein
VLVLEVLTASHEPFATDVEMVPGALDVTLMVCEAGFAPART